MSLYLLPENRSFMHLKALIINQFVVRHAKMLRNQEWVKVTAEVEEEEEEEEEDSVEGSVEEEEEEVVVVFATHSKKVNVQEVTHANFLMKAVAEVVVATEETEVIAVVVEEDVVVVAVVAECAMHFKKENVQEAVRVGLLINNNKL
jgi:uncharacterized membrane protein YdbT with pleckstrin-like domain